MQNPKPVNKGSVMSFIARKYDRVLELLLQAEEESISRSQSIYVSSETSASLTGTSATSYTGTSGGSTALSADSSSSLQSLPSLSSLSSSSEANDLTPRISNKRLLRKVAGSLLLASIEKLRQPRANTNGTDEDTHSRSSDTNNTTYNTDKPAYTNANHSASQTQIPQKESYFLDIFLDKLIPSVLPQNLPERATLNPDAKIPKFSLSTLAANLKRLGTNLDTVFNLQDSIIRLITWNKPERTLAFLVVVTLLLYRPLCIVLSPVIYLMYAVIVPKYVLLHPWRGKLDELNRKSGCCLAGRSLLLDILDVNKNFNKSVVTSDVDISADATMVDLDSGKSVGRDTNKGKGKVNDNRSTSGVSGGVGVVSNLRDLQTFTTSLIKLIDTGSAVVDETVGFSDEWLTTMIFLGSLSLCFALTLWGQLINWSLLLSAIVWFSVILLHPGLYPYTIGYCLGQSMNKERTEMGSRPQSEPQGAKEGGTGSQSRSSIGSYLRSVIEVVADEQPQVKEVEIFEIDKEGVVPGTWESFMFSPVSFGLDDKFRKAQKLPPGVDSLNAVTAPEGWIFDPNSKWEVDTDVKMWWWRWSSSQQSQSSNTDNYVINGEYLVDHEFRRRRLTRRVIMVGGNEKEGGIE